MRKPMRYMACHLACWTHHHVEYNARGLSIIEVFSGTKARILNIRSLLCWKAQLGIICGQGQISINYSLAPGLEGTPAITSHHDVAMKAPVWRKNSSSTSCWNISSLDCRFGWERLSFSAWRSLYKAGNALPVLATLCGWGSILWLKYLTKSAQVLVQCWKAQLGILCGKGTTLSGEDALHTLQGNWVRDLIRLHESEQLLHTHSGACICEVPVVLQLASVTLVQTTCFKARDHLFHSRHFRSLSTMVCRQCCQHRLKQINPRFTRNGERWKKSAWWHGLQAVNSSSIGSGQNSSKHGRKCVQQ